MGQRPPHVSHWGYTCEEGPEGPSPPEVLAYVNFDVPESKNAQDTRTMINLYCTVLQLL